ncbi:DUF4870 domain-containing protein [Xylophilus sp.]|uniref:DUF4870 domain-containing protein n=1 Tax=Xylophilus sp. TaxID=2653893 RepID=UPI0013BD40E3|nr:DUF4870 domain-containing protein [Xylophilus sp.]KAF1048410.1 MAG: hypothetical protein GAK38_01422 [Xylophilus sp.]
MSESDNNRGAAFDPPAAPAVPAPAAAGVPGSDERQWALFAHLSAFTGVFTADLGAVVGPLIFWLVKKDTLPFAAAHAKEALNFNITLALAGVVLFLITLVTFGFGVLLAVPLAIVIGIGWVVLTIIATIKAGNGEAYRYPFTLRLVK